MLPIPSEMSKPQGPQGANEAAEGEEGAKLELCLCVYPGGKFAVQVDDGEPVPVESLDQALEAIRRFAEQAGAPANLDTGTEAPAEAAFQQGFAGARGV